MSFDASSRRIAYVSNDASRLTSLLVASALVWAVGLAGCAQGKVPSEESDAGVVTRVPPQPGRAGPVESEDDAALAPDNPDVAPSDTFSTDDTSGRDPNCADPPCRRDVGRTDTGTTPPDSGPAPDTRDGGDVIDPDPCSALDCGAHGSCRSTPQGARCRCDSGWVAQNGTCVRQSSPCKGQNCDGHGVCRVDNQGQATCDCETGYESRGTDCVPLDRDNDGSIATKDCDDRDDARTPGGNETCDGKDNDCNGTADENLRRKCSNQKGVCSGVEQVCQKGQWTSCQRSYSAAPDYQSDEDRCDGKDNDCDGQTDESCRNGLSCFQLDMCIRLCGANNNSCINNTVWPAGSKAGQRRYNQLATCAQNKCGNARNYAACIKSRCSSEYDACYAPTSGASLSCSEYYRCRARCGSNDTSCLNQCESNRSASARRISGAFESCLRSNCSSTPDLYQCIRRNCFRPFVSCFNCP